MYKFLSDNVFNNYAGVYNFIVCAYLGDHVADLMSSVGMNWT